MNRARIDEGIRQMRFEELLDRHERGELGQELAAQRLGVSDRTFRRWRDRLKDEGPAGLKDRRLLPSGKRAAQAEIERMLGLYRDTYSDFTVKHLQEQLVKRHSYKLGYTGYGDTVRNPGPERQSSFTRGSSTDDQAGARRCPRPAA
jgi:transposase